MFKLEQLHRITMRIDTVPSFFGGFTERGVRMVQNRLGPVHVYHAFRAQIQLWNITNNTRI